MVSTDESRDGARGVTVGWKGKLGKPILAGSRARYVDVQPGVDLVVDVLRTGYEQSFVVKTPAALAGLKGGGAVSWSLPVKTKALTARSEADGSVSFVDAKNVVMSRFAAPTAWDAVVDPRSGEHTSTAAVVLSVAQAGKGKAVVTITPDPVWLADPARVFPITIDPTYASGGNVGPSFDTYVSKASPSATYSTGTELKVGTYNGGVDAARSFLTFPLATIKDKDIISASLSLHEFHSWSCTPAPFYVYSANAATASSTWANQPPVVTSYGNVSVAKGYSSSCAAGRVSVPVTAMVQAWSGSASGVAAIRLHASESDNVGWKKFSSVESTQDPYVTFTYNRKPNAPTTPVMASGWGYGGSTYVAYGSTAIRSSATDPDGSGVKVTFEVHTTNVNASAATKVASCESALAASGATASCNSAPALSDNATRYVRAAVKDELGLWNGTWSPWTAFKTALSKPAAPSVTCPGYVDGSWADTAPAADVACTVSVPASPAGVNNQPITIRAYVDGASTATATIDTGKSAGTFGGFSLPRAAGGHSIKVTTQTASTWLSDPATFSAGYGMALAEPAVNQVTAGRVPLKMLVDPSMTAVLGKPQYQYRRGDADPWHPIPTADVRTAAGVAVTDPWPAAADSVSQYVWDAPATLGGGGTVDVRVLFGGNNAQTAPRTVTVDIDAGQAGTGTAGPGSVNLSTGQLSLSGSDANWFGVGIGRSYGSRSLTAGTSEGQAGAFGPQWEAFGASGTDSSYTMVAKTSPTSLDVVTAGGVTSFTLKAGTSGAAATWVPEPGAEDLHLVGDPAGAGGSVFTLTGTDRTLTVFKKTAGGPVDTWPVYSTNSSGDDNTARYGSVVDAAGKLRLSVIAAPNPGLTPAQLDVCATIPVPAAGPARGCRILALSWAVVTTDTGDQWRVTGIDAWAWDPATSAMTKTTLAGFGYDANGWLTSATDTITNLVTSYAYDPAGLLTSLTPAHAPSAPTARLPWTFGYAGAGVTAAPLWDRTTPTSGGRLVTVTRATLTPGSLTATNGTATTAIVYGVPVTKTGHGPADVAANNAASWGQYDPAFEGTAIFEADAAAQPGPGTDFWAGDDTTTRSWTAAAVTYIDVNGRDVNHLGRDGGLDAASYDTDGNQVFALSAGNRAIATGEAPGADALGLAGQTSAAIGQQLATVNGYQGGTTTTVGDEPAQRLAYTAGPLHTVVTAAGDQVRERAVTRNTYDQGRPAAIAGSTVPPVADVATSTVTGGVLYGADPATAALDDPRTTTSTYDWALGQSPAVTVDPSPAAGDEITTRTSYDTDGRPISATMPGGTAAGTTLTTYYDTAIAAPCTGHPEWGGMVCTTAAQGPIAGGANPDLVSTTVTYTRTGAPAEVVETANAINRTTTITYDSAERPATVAVAATTATGAATTALGAAVATRTLTYDPDTGETSSLSATISGASQTIATTSDALGRQVSVTDGTGLAGDTQYDTLDRPTKVSETDTANALPGGGHRTYATTGSYDPVTGRLTSSTDDQTGTTTLGYDIDGAITSQGVTTGAGTLTVTQSGDPTGAPTARQWRLAGATDPLSSEQVTSNIHGQWIDHSTTAGTVRRYAYDGASRLTAVTNLDSGAACNARSYSYNTNSDRIGEAATTPVPAGTTTATNPTGCATPAPSATTHTFDSADRLTDTGYTYDTFGRTTRLPLGGATGTALTGQVMRVGYNVNDLVATQQVYANAADADAASGAGQNPTATQTYTLDPTGGRLQSFTKTAADPDTGLPVTTTKTNRYASRSDSPEWIDEGATGPAANTLTRNITGPAGGLLATTSNPAAGGTGTLDWQLTSLHGDVAVTLPDDPTQVIKAVPLADEFGIPDPTDTATRGADDRYRWLGAAQRSTEAPGGITLMGVRLYNPTTGRFLSTDPIFQGSANAYDYANQDPINAFDLSGLSFTRCNGNGAFRGCRTYLSSQEAWDLVILIELGVAVSAALSWLFGLSAGVGVILQVGAAYFAYLNQTSHGRGIYISTYYFADWTWSRRRGWRKVWSLYWAGVGRR